MSYISLKEHLIDSPNLKPTEPVNEFLITAIGISMMATACAPLFDKDFFKHIGTGIGALLGGIGSLFGFIGKKSDDKDKGKDNDKGSGGGSGGGKNDGGSKGGKTNDKDDADDEEDEMTDEQKQKAAMVLNANMLKQDLKAKQEALAEKKKELEAAKDEDRKTLEDDVKKAEEAVEAAQRNHDLIMANGFDDDGNPVDADTFKENLGKSGMDKDAIDKLESEAGKVDPKDFEKTINEHCKNIIKDGKIDESALGKVRDELKSDVKAAKERLKKASEEPENDDDTGSEESNTGEETKTEPSGNSWSDEDKKKAKEEFAEKKKELEDAAKQAKEAAEKSGKTEAAEKLQKKIDGEIKAAEKAIEDGDKAAYEKSTKSLTNLQKGQERQMGIDDRDEEKEFKIHHDGKEDSIIRRKSKRGDGVVYCYKSDPATTISPKEAKRMLRKNGIKESMSLSEWLGLFLDED